MNVVDKACREFARSETSGAIASIRERAESIESRGEFSVSTDAVRAYADIVNLAVLRERAVYEHDIKERDAVIAELRREISRLSAALNPANDD